MSKNCTPLWREAHLEVKMLKNWGSGSTFWSSDVDKMHAAVAKRRFGSENVQNMSASEHFFEVPMSKKFTPLWQNAHLEVNMLKNWHSGSTFCSSDVEQLYAAVARSTFGSENVKKLRVREHFLKFWRRKNARRCSEKEIWKWKCTKHVSFGALLEVLMSKN